MAGDALRLPFADAAFDAVTISFGLRNVADVDAALAEMARVTRPGGRLVVCEFSHPTWAPFRTVYTEYLMRALPSVARRVSSNPDAYVYLAESIRAWPDQAGAGPAGRGRGLDRRRLAQPHRRHRGPAPRPPCLKRFQRRGRRGFAPGPIARTVLTSTRREAPHGCRRQDQNKVEEIAGDAKERIGGATGDDELRREGKRDQTEANLKQAGEKVKDAFKTERPPAYRSEGPVRWTGPSAGPGRPA